MNQEDSNGWMVKVVEDATGDIVKAIPARNEREAGRIERGIDINLDHDKFTCYSVGPAD